MTLRFGLVGLGSMGRNHARVLRGLDGVELVGAADPAGDPTGALNGKPVVPAVDDLLELDLDACVVAAPTAHHEKVGLRLAAAGVHTLIEKPLTPDIASAGRVADAFDAADLVGAVGHIERFNPAIRAMRERIESGALGDLYQVSTRRQGPFPARIADVGVILDLATHDIDLTAWATGRRFASVGAATAHRSGREHEDLVAFLGRLEGDLISSHLVNWLSPMKERVTTVVGEKGALVADTLTADLTFHANGKVEMEWETLAVFRGVSEGDVTRFAIPKPEPLRVELQAFRDAVLGISAEHVTMRQAADVVAVAAAVSRAASDGAVHAVEYGAQ